MTFKPAFSGAKNIYMNAVNNANASVGVAAKGSWTAVTAPPVNIAVAPVSGSGATRIFTSSSDPYGYADIHYVEVLFQSSLSTQNACYVQYSRIQLYRPIGRSGYSYAGLSPPGIAAGEQQQCIVDAGASFFSGSGNNLTLTLALTLSRIQRSKNIYMDAVNNAMHCRGGSQRLLTVP